jgi:hypothetical protein
MWPKVTFFGARISRVWYALHVREVRATSRACFANGARGKCNNCAWDIHDMRGICAGFLVRCYTPNIAMCYRLLSCHNGRYILHLVLLHSVPQQISPPEKMQDRPFIGRLVRCVLLSHASYSTDLK